MKSFSRSVAKAVGFLRRLSFVRQAGGTFYMLKERNEERREGKEGNVGCVCTYFSGSIFSNITASSSATRTCSLLLGRSVDVLFAAALSWSRR